MLDAVCCYECLSLCLSVCLLITAVSRTKTAEMIVTRFGMWTHKRRTVYIRWGRHLATTMERSMFDGGAVCRYHHCSILLAFSDASDAGRP